MTDEVYNKLIEGLAIVGATRLGFGLFNDPLCDPKIVDRTRDSKTKMPSTPIQINTNGILLKPEIARELMPYVDRFLISFHALDKQLYKTLMPSMNQEEVISNIKWVANNKLSHNEVTIAIVKNKLNSNEEEKLKQYFSADGVIIEPDKLMNRAGLLAEVFEKTAMEPIWEGCCDMNVTGDLIVDWDGKVLLCCQDFEKKLVIGDLSVQTFDEVLNDIRRKQIAQKLTQKQHKEILTCSRCKISMGSSSIVS